MSPTAWLGLYLGCLALGAALWHSRAQGLAATDALAAGIYALWLAAIFYGADGALAALHGPHRKDPGVSQLLGGLELWFVFCPGLVSLALATALRRRLA